jgi:hypothetical protein
MKTVKKIRQNIMACKHNIVEDIAEWF